MKLLWQTSLPTQIFIEACHCPVLCVLRRKHGIDSILLLQMVDVWTARGYPFPNFHFVLCDSLSGGNIGHLEAKVGPSRGNLHKMLQRLEVGNLRSVVVDHCHESYGLIVHSQRGWSVVYSGDTRPCHRLIQAGVGCTLLIHEATFEDNLADHAIRKRHSTVPEALDVGLRMAAQYVVLTHFSQRYPQVRFFASSNMFESCCYGVYIVLVLLVRFDMG